MKDKFGNDLSRGDLVECDLTVKYVIGRVVELKRGGLVIGKTPDGKTVISPDVLIIACEFNASPPFNQMIKKLHESKGVEIAN